VPVPGATNQVAQAEEPTEIAGVTSPRPGLADPPIRMFVHTPYLDRQCGDCHESRFSQKMKGPMN
jgi:hypothetical protein